jgi:hypothetical protein
MRPYRDVAAVAGAQVICFFLLSHLEPDFFLLHLYQTILYVALLVLLFYMEDRWAYMIGMLASVVWLGMAYSVGLLSSAFRHIVQWDGNAVGFLAAATALLAVLMIGACGRHWMKEYAGLGKALNTFLVSLGIVGVYYAILIIWFWHRVPTTVNG